MFVVAFFLMKDIGFTPTRGDGVVNGIRQIAGASVEYGLRVPSVKWLMLASPFTAGVGIYAFYALQPYLLELWGDPTAYGIAGLVAAIVAGAQIVGGLAAPWIRRLFTPPDLGALRGHRAGRAHAHADRRRPELLGRAGADRRVGPAVRGVDADPARVSERDDPLRAACHDPLLRLDDGLERRRRASSPCWGARPTSGATPASYLLGGVITALALPFLVLSRRQGSPADTATGRTEVAGAGAPSAASAESR